MMQLTGKLVHDFDATVSELKAVVSTPINEKDRILVSMHKDAQAGALIHCVTVMREILRDILILNTDKTPDFAMGTDEVVDLIQSELGVFEEYHVETLTFFSELAGFLGMCDKGNIEDRAAFDDAMIHMHDMCETLTLMVEGFKGDKK